MTNENCLTEGKNDFEDIPRLFKKQEICKFNLYRIFG